MHRSLVSHVGHDGLLLLLSRCGTPHGRVVLRLRHGLLGGLGLLNLRHGRRRLRCAVSLHGLA